MLKDMHTHACKQHRHTHAHAGAHTSEINNYIEHNLLIIIKSKNTDGYIYIFYININNM